MTKNAERREKFRKIGAAISSLNPHVVRDPQAGICLANPWKVIKGATGFYGMQIDTRPGLTRKLDDEQE